MTALERACVAIGVNDMREKGFSESVCAAIADDQQARLAAVKTYASTVRAALLAIREPDAGDVIKACVQTVDKNGHAHPPAMFTAMIDAVLAEAS